MKTDIYRKMERDFGSEISLALKQVEAPDLPAEGVTGDRVLRAMVFLAKGDLETLEQLIKLASTDYRDVLWQAEYDCGDKRRFDFSRSFHELGLLEEASL